MALQLFIGQSNLRGAIGKYASRFNLLELRADQERLPREAVLRRWAEEVPERFVFSVLIAPQHLRESSGPKSVVDRVTSAASCLHAKWIVVQTDPMWGPSQRTKQRLRELFAPLLDESRRVAWEPHGVWQDEEAFAYAGELGVHYVRDIGRGDPLGQAVVYSRMPGLGVSARMSLGAMERAAANIGSAAEAYLVVGGEGAHKLQQLLPELVQSQLRGSGRISNADSMVETFGGFVTQGADEDEMFDDFDDDDGELEQANPEQGDEGDEGEELGDEDEDEELGDDEDEGEELGDDEDEEDEGLGEGNEDEQDDAPIDDETTRAGRGGASRRAVTHPKRIQDKKKSGRR